MRRKVNPVSGTDRTKPGSIDGSTGTVFIHTTPERFNGKREGVVGGGDSGTNQDLSGTTGNNGRGGVSRRGTTSGGGASCWARPTTELARTINTAVAIRMATPSLFPCGRILGLRRHGPAH